MYTVKSTSVRNWYWQKFRKSFGSFAANLPQRNYNKTHYGNFEIGSTLANHLRVFDETFRFLANLEPADDSPVISDGEIIFSKIPAYDTNKVFWSYTFYSRDSN